MILSKPMLASTVRDISLLSYPLLGSVKLDGIRSLFFTECEDTKLSGPVSRTFKTIPNRYIVKELNDLLSFGYYGNFDGELLSVDSDGKLNTFQKITHDIMSFEGEPNFRYYIFDYIRNELSEPYEERMKVLASLPINDPRVIKLLPTVINNEAELLAFETKALAEGFEGVILRSPSSPYKCGRSTLKENYLLKLKRFEDSEAEIIGFDELYTNNNEKVKNLLGHSERSTHQENMIPADTLGALLVRDTKSGIEFKLGSGYSEKLRKEIWDGRSDWLGKIVKYKFFNIGVLEKPRHPIYLGVRHGDDMSPSNEVSENED